MNQQQAYDLLTTLDTIHPANFDTSGRATYLVVKLTETDDNVNLTSTIVDPEMPDEGDANSYLALRPVQRTILDLSRIVNEVTPGLAQMSVHIPLEEDLWKKVDYDANRFARNMQVLALRYSAQILENCK